MPLVTCTTCNDTGWVHACPDCEGMGSIDPYEGGSYDPESVDNDGRTSHYHAPKCRPCGGRGTFPGLGSTYNERCPDCSGSLYVPLHNAGIL